MEGPENAGDRRRQPERREGAPATGFPETRRGGTRPSGMMYAAQAVGAIVMLLAVIVFAVRTMHPVYATRGTLGDELRKHAPGAAAALGAGTIDSTNVDRLMATAKFQEEKRNFYEDVMRLKQVDSARADSIAQYAVREAYVRGISPAIIFGVMLTENSKFVSKAQSNVGAVGLMQVYPKVWLTKEMTKLFGHDLASDSTNVKYGVFILSQYFNPRVKGGGTAAVDWATALLHYNGCVHGTNTPRCHTYPNKVQSFVENQATSICGGRSFYDCIAKPFINGLFKGGKLAPDDSSTKAVVATAADIATDSSRQGATVMAAGEVASAAGPIVLPPVVVDRPDSTSGGPSAAAEAPAAVNAPASAPKAATSHPSHASHGKGTKTVAKKAPARHPGASAHRSAPKQAAPKKVVKRTPAVLKAPKPITIKLP